MSDSNPSENNPSSSLNPNEAVERAAQQSQRTADKNIPLFATTPGFEDFPLEDDTANLRLGPNLHDGLLALLPLIGVWRGQGQVAPTQTEEEERTFGQQIIFSHDGNNYINYQSHLWLLDEDNQPTGSEFRESGFLRINDKDDIEFFYTRSDGTVEIMYGKPRNERAWELESASVMVTETAPTHLGPGKRLYGLLPNNNLGWVDERLQQDQLRPWRSAELYRMVG